MRGKNLVLLGLLVLCVLLYGCSSNNGSSQSSEATEVSSGEQKSTTTDDNQGDESEASDSEADSSDDEEPSADEDVIVKYEESAWKSGKYITTVHYYDFNSDGQERTRYYYDPSDGTVFSILEHEYDSDGRPIASRRYDVQQYDPVNHTYRLGDLQHSTEYEYYDDDSEYDYSCTYYDENGDEGETSYYDNNNELFKTVSGSSVTIYKHEYDSEGRVLSIAEGFNNPSNGLNVSKYPIEEIEGEEFYIKKTTTYEYDDMGCLTHYIEQSNENESYNVDLYYEYDENNRRVKVVYGPQCSDSGDYGVKIYSETNPNVLDREEYYSKNGKFLFSIQYYYDTSGRETREVKVDNASDTIWDRLWSYSSLSYALEHPFATEG